RNAGRNQVHRTEPVRTRHVQHGHDVIVGASSLVERENKDRIVPGRALHQPVDEVRGELRTYLNMVPGVWLAIYGTARMLIPPRTIARLDQRDLRQGPAVQIKLIFRDWDDLAPVIVGKRLEAEDPAQWDPVTTYVGVVDLPGDTVLLE